MSDNDTVPRCAGCGFTHSTCTTQRQVEDLLAQLYGAVKNDVGIELALDDVDRFLS